MMLSVIAIFNYIEKVMRFRRPLLVTMWGNYIMVSGIAPEPCLYNISDVSK